MDLLLQNIGNASDTQFALYEDKMIKSTNSKSVKTKNVNDVLLHVYY